jgi:hypothetical protein
MRFLVKKTVISPAISEVGREKLSLHHTNSLSRRRETGAC